MDLKDKIIGMALTALIALVGWNLHETWDMKEQVFKLQQGQIVLSKQIKKNSTFVKQKLKQIKNKKDKERYREKDKEFVDSFDTTPILTNAVQRRLDSLPEIDLSVHKDRQLFGYNYLEYLK